MLKEIKGKRAIERAVGLRQFVRENGRRKVKVSTVAPLGCSSQATVIKSRELMAEVTG